jgi:hypothetical protein
MACRPCLVGLVFPAAAFWVFWSSLYCGLGSAGDTLPLETRSAEGKAAASAKATFGAASTEIARRSANGRAGHRDDGENPRG